MDNNDNYEGLFGPFVANFHLHHRTPLYKKKPVLFVYFDESGSKIWMAPLEIIVILLSTKIPTFITFTFMYFFIFSSFAELSHYFCHTIDGKYINFMHKYTANIPKILTLCDYCDKLLTRLEIIVSFIMSLKTKYGGK